MKPWPSLALLLLAGCASQVWYQDGKSPAQAYTDWADCERRARQIEPAHFTHGLASALAHGDWRDLAAHDMRGRGYRVVPASSVTNGTDYPHP